MIIAKQNRKKKKQQDLNCVVSVYSTSNDFQIIYSVLQSPMDA